MVSVCAELLFITLAQAIWVRPVQEPVAEINCKNKLLLLALAEIVTLEVPPETVKVYHLSRLKPPGQKPIAGAS